MVTKLYLAYDTPWWSEKGDNPFFYFAWTEEDRKQYENDVRIKIPRNIEENRFVLRFSLYISAREIVDVRHWFYERCRAQAKFNVGMGYRTLREGSGEYSWRCCSTTNERVPSKIFGRKSQLDWTNCYTAVKFRSPNIPHSTEYCRNMSGISLIFHCNWNILVKYCKIFHRNITISTLCNIFENK